MNESQSISLKEPVSMQRLGVVLVWSAFSENSEQDYNWSSFFVPKTIVGTDGATGVMCSSVGIENVMSKYVYVENELIRGYSGNTNDGTFNGINIKNSAFVLRYVLGV